MSQVPKFPGSLAARMRGPARAHGGSVARPSVPASSLSGLTADEVGADKVRRLIDAQSQEVDERMDEGKGGV